MLSKWSFYTIVTFFTKTRNNLVKTYFLYITICLDNLINILLVNYIIFLNFYSYNTLLEPLYTAPLVVSTVINSPSLTFDNISLADTITGFPKFIPTIAA